MAREPLAALDAVIAAIDGIRSSTADFTLEQYRNNRLVRCAVEREFEIRSEASRSLPDTWKSREIEIRRKDIASIGNVSRHVYDQIEDQIIWITIQKTSPICMRH